MLKCSLLDTMPKPWPSCTVYSCRGNKSDSHSAFKIYSSTVIRVPHLLVYGLQLYVGRIIYAYYSTSRGVVFTLYMIFHRAFLNNYMYYILYLTKRCTVHDTRVSMSVCLKHAVVHTRHMHTAYHMYTRNTTYTYIHKGSSGKWRFETLTNLAKFAGTSCAGVSMNKTPMVIHAYITVRNTEYGINVRRQGQKKGQSGFVLVHVVVTRNPCTSDI